MTDFFMLVTSILSPIFTCSNQSKALLACIIIVNLRRLLCQITETDKLSFYFLPSVSDWPANENKCKVKNLAEDFRDNFENHKDFAKKDKLGWRNENYGEGTLG